MLDRTNRIVQPADFRTVVRRGRRILSKHLIVHVASRNSAAVTRFGFIVTKSVGGAVARNRVKRRLRAIGGESLHLLGPGKDIVIRALPGSSEADWATLHAEITDSLNKGVVMR